MKVSFGLFFCNVHPVTGGHTWHHALVMCPSLDMTSEQIWRVVRDALILDRHGSLGAITQLAHNLRELPDVEDDLDKPPVTIIWQPLGLSDAPEIMDVAVEINWDDGRVRVNGSEFLFCNFYHPRDDAKGVFVREVEMQRVDYREIAARCAARGLAE